MAAIIVVMATDAALQLRREIALFEDDMARDEEAMGRVLQVAVERIAATGGGGADGRRPGPRRSALDVARSDRGGTGAHTRAHGGDPGWGGRPRRARGRQPGRATVHVRPDPDPRRAPCGARAVRAAQHAAELP